MHYALSRPQDAARDLITAATRIGEAEAVQRLLPAATLSPSQQMRSRERALSLARAVRATRREAGGADALIQAFSLSSEEGIALMCLAEALLRIPDADTADRLIRDKVGRGDWRIADSDSLFVNATSWGMVVTGKLMSRAPDRHRLTAALGDVLGRLGEPVIRTAMRAAMRFLGEQFVLGETIDAALARARPREARGYRYSYDMLGEAALTDADARRYEAAYVDALRAIGKASNGRGVEPGPGLSVKLSALHPRYSRAQRDRVMAELLPRLKALALLARDADIGLNIDAEEADRLEISLDLFEALARDRDLGDWTGLGIVVQAYQKRAPQVLDWVIELARSSGRRMMVRLVKGAYWDSEIKRAQVDGLSDYPVYTRKVHTDIAYLACARKLLASRDLLYPQFATHNAATLAAIVEIAGGRTGYEFQCLHGMGEALYDHVVAKDALDLPCRIYAPVGTHETLLAYLVRRLLENGANTSFVNQVADPAVDLEALVADPVTLAAPFHGSPHPRIVLPGALFTDRANSRGRDLASESVLRDMEQSLSLAATHARHAYPLVVGRDAASGTGRALHSPQQAGRLVGIVTDATPADIASAFEAAQRFRDEWAAWGPARRATLLERAADLMEARTADFVDLAVREAGKTLGNAIGEVREAVDFLRYYARDIRARPPAEPIGVVVAISPWNFPLAIFTGQVAAALAAGNVVLAKPAEQTPLIAFEAVRTLHEAGVPAAALQFLPGDGESLGAALVGAPGTQAVVFTGSTGAAAHIHRSLAQRGNLALIAETGGQNAMIVDASALPEQVVADVIASAFDSGGQRCSALRLLCLQEEIAERVLEMLAGAMAELRVGDPAQLGTDVGPIIDSAARAMLESEVARLSRNARLVARAPLDPRQAGHGHFVAPVAFEIAAVDALTHEIFGPVLHVVRYRSQMIDALVDAINRTGYALTLGVHSRIDATVERIVARSHAGNVYVNRNMIGAVVGVQPFGGHGLSGTGPKAGGPLYVARLTRDPGESGGRPERSLPGPTGEENRWRCLPRGRLAALGGGAGDDATWLAQARAALDTGNSVVFMPPKAERDAARRVAESLASSGRIEVLEASDTLQLDGIQGALAADPDRAAQANRMLAARDGARLPVIEAVGDPPRYPGARLCLERTVSVNTTAAGGNASLVAMMD